MSLPNIAFLGRAGAGKTTAAQYLAENFNYSQVSFASTLKDVAVKIWGPDVLTDRGKLQDLGVAVRAIDTDAWVNAVADRIAAADHHVVVDDCRFPNEYDLLVEHGFVFVRIYSRRAQRIERLRDNGRLQDERQLEHETETALDEYPLRHGLANYTSRSAFEAKVLRFLNKEAARA